MLENLMILFLCINTLVPIARAQGMYITHTVSILFLWLDI